MLASIIVLLIVGVICAIIIARMVDNVKHGRSIDGCDGDCSHCSSCHHKGKC